VKSSHCFCPTPKRTFPEFSIILGFGKVSSQIEQIVDGAVSIEEPLSLPYRFEPSHHPLSHPGRFMGLLCTIVRVPISDMGCFRDQPPMCDSIRIAVGPQQGRKVFTLQTLPDCGSENPFVSTVGEVAGFSLYMYDVSPYGTN